MRKVLMSLITVLFICSCGPKNAADNPQRELTPLTIGSGKNAVKFEVETAVKDDEMRKGLMFRKELPSNQGMIFMITPPKAISMWMKNTYIPLDMVFVNDENKISGIVENAKPLSESFIYSPEKTKAVVELNGGAVKKFKLRKGALVKHKLLGNSGE